MTSKVERICQNSVLIYTTRPDWMVIIYGTFL